MDVPTAVRAVAVEQLDDAIRRLGEDYAHDPVTAVHEARKDLKKTRSLLRLVRTGMDPEARRAANGALRDIAASLAGSRDADVMVATASALRKRFPGKVPTAVDRRLEADAQAAS